MVFLTCFLWRFSDLLCLLWAQHRISEYFSFQITVNWEQLEKNHICDVENALDGHSLPAELRTDASTFR